jgi:hypothetical protein
MYIAVGIKTFKGTKNTGISVGIMNYELWVMSWLTPLRACRHSTFKIQPSTFAFSAAATGTHVPRRSLTCGYENNALRAAVHNFYC